MNTKIENGKPYFFSEPVKVKFTNVTGTEEVEIAGKTFHKAAGEKSEFTLSADDMNAVGWTIDGSAGQPHWRQLEDVKVMFFKNAGANTKISEDVQSMKSAMSELSESFFDGKITESQLAGRFQSLAEDFISACREKQYPFPTLNGFDEAELSFAYDCFRGAILKTAAARNNAEGRELCSKYNSGWRYYNADYYYMSESAVSAISERAREMASERGFDKFEIPDYKAIGKNSLYNFNSVLSGEWDYIPGSPVQPVNEKWILDFDAVPPEGFKYFFEAEGHDSQTLFVSSGDEPEFPGLKSRMWAMYKDMMVSCSFMFSRGHDQPSDVKNAGDLLQFRSKIKDEVAAVNDFLKNLQAAPMWYFTNTGRRDSAGRQSGGWEAEA